MVMKVYSPEFKACWRAPAPASADGGPAAAGDALRAAAATRGSLAGAVFHSDHGARYTSHGFARACAESGVQQSTGAVGTSADNALAESFNAALTRETPRGARRFDGARACRLAVFRRTTRYSTRRRHSANGQQAPIVHEQQSATPTLTAQRHKQVSTLRGQDPRPGS